MSSVNLCFYSTYVLDERGNCFSCILRIDFRLGTIGSAGVGDFWANSAPMYSDMQNGTTIETPVFRQLLRMDSLLLQERRSSQRDVIFN